MACFDEYITVNANTPSESGLYVTDLPGVTVAQLDGLTKDEQADFEALFENIYKNSQINLKIDVQKKLAQRFHIDRKLVSRETSAFLDEENTATSLAGVKLEWTLPKYAKVKLLSVGLDALESPLQEWTVRFNSAENSWTSIAYGKGIFVAVADSGTGTRVMTSPDGVTWTTRTSAADNVWNSVAFGNGVFVAVSGNGTSRVMTSPDGITWTLRTQSVSNAWQEVTFGNGIFVAVSDTGTGDRVMTSPDGVTWTTRTSAADNNWASVTFGNGVFVAVAQSGTGDRVMTSPDGITWTSRTSAADNSWTSVTYGNGRFVTVSDSGTGNRVMTSDDGITWTIRVSAANNSWNSVSFGNNLFVAVASSGTGNRVMTSPDGVTWTIMTSAANNSWNSVVYGENRFVSVAGSGSGNRVMTAETKIDIEIYEENEDGDLLSTVSKVASEGENTIHVNEDFEVDSLFVSYDPTLYSLNKSENKYYANSRYYNFDKLSCTYPCFYGGDAGASIQQINGGGLNVKFVIYCSMEKFICENLNLFQYALWYRIGVDLMKERIVSDRATRFTVLTTERAQELLQLYNEEYQNALEAATMNIKMQEDPICFECKRTITAKVSLP